MSKKIIGMLILLFGAMMFFGFFYLLPFGTDWYLYFWVVVVFHGNWLYGDIAANVVALAGMFVGYVLMRSEGHDPLPDIKPKKSKKGRRYL